MKPTFSMLLPGLFAALAFCPAAEAHTFGASGAGLAAGLAHPFGGADHWLAMLALGVWAGQCGGRCVWLLPLTFVGVMAAAAALAMAGAAPPLPPEPLAAGSAPALGLLVALAARPGVWAGAALAGLFAFGHGHAHGLELPASASPALYALGFCLATAALHGLGLGLGRAVRRAAWASRLCGSALALAGLYALAMA